MSEEKKCTKNEEIREGKEKLSIDELDKVNGRLKPDPERLRKKVEDVYPV